MDKFAGIFILWVAFIIAAAAHEFTDTPAKPPQTTYDLDVTHFGAVGDGIRDDSRAFQSAWKAACNATENHYRLTVPAGKTFLVFPVKFEGPCKSSSVTFEILGNIVAPPRAAWTKKSSDEWLYFHKVDGLIVDGKGQGLVSGRGETWWIHGASSSRPTAMRFSHCTKLQVRGLKHKSSQKNHVSINQCDQAIVSNLEMHAPQKSPNTDGIDISHSTNLYIRDSVMATGDDCIAINGGTSNVSIHNITCGPGHGISIGSLGKKGKHDEVEAISVTNCTFNGTENGVRIKTWQGGAGFARNITFSNINFIAANNPVIIDQYYCPHKICANETSAVEVSHVTYSQLHGTSTCTNATINFSCSKTVPCTNIIVNDVDIKPSDPHHPLTSHCINAYGKVSNAEDPTVTCLLP